MPLSKIKSLEDVVVEQLENNSKRIRVGNYTGPEYKFICKKILSEGVLAYEAQSKGGKWLVSINGQEGPKYVHVWNLVESKRHFAYIAETEDKKDVVNIDGQESAKYVHIWDLIVSEDGNFEYTVETDNKEEKVVKETILKR